MTKIVCPVIQQNDLSLRSGRLQGFYKIAYYGKTFRHDKESARDTILSKVLLQWGNWVKTWAGAFPRFLGIDIGKNCIKISITTMILTTFLTIDVDIGMSMKSTVQFLFLLESLVQFFTPPYHLLNVP